VDQEAKRRAKKLSKALILIGVASVIKKHKNSGWGEGEKMKI